MSESSEERLVYVTTEDGLSHAGIEIRPRGVAARPPTVVWIHGNGASFHDYATVAIGRELAALGYGFVSGDTRGHDIAAFLPRAGGGMPVGGGGAAWELWEEAPLDVAAWVSHAAALGGGRVVLAGHSVGAGKVVLYQAERQDERVRGVVLASPSVRAFSPPGTLEAAQRLVAEGRGMAALPATPYAPWYLQSARNAVSAATVWSRLFEATDAAPAVARLGVPLLALCGAHERDADERLTAVREAANAAGPLQTALIPGADHFFSGAELAVAHAIAGWAARTPHA